VTLRRRDPEASGKEGEQLTVRGRVTMSQPESEFSQKEVALLEMLSLVYEEMDINSIEERFVNLTADIFGFLTAWPSSS
jgi:hypothetical protein